jgi:hypothetical protein
MGFLACLFRCPQEDVVEEDGDEMEGEQYRINRQVVSGDDSIPDAVFCFWHSRVKTLLLLPTVLLCDAFLIICLYLPCYYVML